MKASIIRDAEISAIFNDNVICLVRREVVVLCR